METYKYKSRLITVIIAIIVYLSTITVDTWQTILPQEYVYLAPGIVIVIGFLVNQLSEEKRVTVAEQLVHEQYSVSEDDI